MVCNHQHINLKWVANYNFDVVEHFAFVLNGEKIWVHLGAICFKTIMIFLVMQTTFAHVLQLIIVDCKHKIPNQNPFSYFC